MHSLGEEFVSSPTTCHQGELDLTHVALRPFHLQVPHTPHTNCPARAPLTCTPPLPQGDSAASRRRRFCSDKCQPLFSATLPPVCDNPHGPDNLRQEMKRKRRPFCVSECGTELTLPVANTDSQRFNPRCSQGASEPFAVQL